MNGSGGGVVTTPGSAAATAGGLAAAHNGGGVGGSNKVFTYSPSSPSLEHLATAEEAKVKRKSLGLSYYSRGGNL